MMSSENLPPTSLPENQSSSGNNNNSKGVAALPPEQPLKCPRCDSSNTKFCYYNNYSLSQPRHFCKTCRRYWTRGGALRNVPIGGGCRKSKKFKSSAVAATTATSRLFEPSGEEFGPGPGPGPGFKLMSSGPGPGPVEFQLGGLSLPRLHPATAGVYTQYITNAGSGSGSGPGFGLDLFGSNYPAPTTATKTAVSGGGDHHPISLSSIESLSSMNQEMHWKLQQQRLALIYGGDHDHESHQIQNHKEMKPLAAINLFQQLEICSNNSNNNNNSGAYNNTTTTTTTNNNNNISTPKLSTECGNEINTGGPGSGRKEEVGPTEWFFDPTNQENGCATVIATSQEVEPTVVAFDGVRPVIATTTTTTTTTDGAASWGDFQFNGFH